MPFTCHSHSGQFCAHAHDSLEDMVRQAIHLKMSAMVLTEHMPRDNDEYLYPEELEANYRPTTLAKAFDDYYHEATRLQAKYAADIEILLGFETEWFCDSTLASIQGIQQNYQLQVAIGSVHHVSAIPVDYDQAMFDQAREASGGSEGQLFAAYFDAQFEMLQALKPVIVGHLDLIRLKSKDPNASWKTYPSVWERIARNLKFITSYQGLLEVNSSALRKGLLEPYPNGEICRAFLELGGRFTLSDDSHSVYQVGWGYRKVLDFLDSTGISDVQMPTSTPDKKLQFKKLTLQDMRAHAFFQ
ncbi:MAG: histidinolphosphatase [Vezdaea aestivalis]|nr:MAG: histidinolphosphatase [Vezdaea aestivalis]